MRKAILVFVFVIVFAGLPTSAVIVFNDGDYHLIDYVINDDVEVSGVGTQVDIKEGGSLNKLWSYGNSIIDISGGTMTGGLQANDNSLATISGGTIGMYVHASGSSQIIVSGGNFDGYGFLINYMGSPGASVITFMGSAFQIDGNPVSYGQYFPSDYPPSDPRTYGSHIYITGVLQNGDLLDDNLSMFDSASIVLVPEPGTALLLGLGGLFLRRKC